MTPDGPAAAPLRAVRRAAKNVATGSSTAVLSCGGGERCAVGMLAVVSGPGSGAQPTWPWCLAPRVRL